MTVQPTIDHGQQLARPEGHTIGFVDTKEQFDEVLQALHSAGHPDASIIALHLEDGIQMLTRLQKKFFFGDGEDGCHHYILNKITGEANSVADDCINYLMRMHVVPPAMSPFWGPVAAS